jgi:hypothetical protein
VDARGLCQVMGYHGSEWPSVRGTAVPWAALASPPPSARGRDGARPPAAGLPPRAGPRVVPAVTNARAGSARTATGPDHQGEAERPAGHRAKSRRSPLGRG